MVRTNFENLRVYQLSEEIADLTWEIVVKWKRLAQNTVGQQLIKQADSIGANIAEGTGRGSYADNRRFARIARGSLFEVKHWLRRAYRRDLLSETEVSKLQNLINELTPKLSAYINSIGNRKEKSDKQKQICLDNLFLFTTNNAFYAKLQLATNNEQPTANNLPHVIHANDSEADYIGAYNQQCKVYNTKQTIYN